MHDQEAAIASRAEQMDMKLDDRLSEIRNKLNQRLDEMSNGRQKEIMSRILALSQ